MDTKTVGIFLLGMGPTLHSLLALNADTEEKNRTFSFESCQTIDQQIEVAGCMKKAADLRNALSGRGDGSRYTAA